VPGTLPLGVGDVFFRVFIQILIEIIADVLPSIVHVCMTRVLGYHLPLIMPEMLHDYVDITKLRLSYKKKSSIAAPRGGAPSATVAPFARFSPLTESDAAAATLQQLRSGADILFVHSPTHSSSASAADGENSSARSMSMGDDGRLFKQMHSEADPAAFAPAEQAQGSARHFVPARLGGSGGAADGRVHTALSDEDPGAGADLSAAMHSTPTNGQGGCQGTAGARTETGATAATAGEVYVSDTDVDQGSHHCSLTSAHGSTPSAACSHNPLGIAGTASRHGSDLHSAGLTGEDASTLGGFSGIGTSPLASPDIMDMLGGGLGGLQAADDDRQREIQSSAGKPKGQDASRQGGRGADTVSVKEFHNDAPLDCLKLTQSENKLSVRLYLELLQETAPEVTAERQAVWTDLSYHQLSALLVAAAMRVDGMAPCPRLGSDHAFVQDVLSQELYREGFVPPATFGGSGEAVADENLLGYALRSVINHRGRLLGAMRSATQAAATAGQHNLPPTATGGEDMGTVDGASASVGSRSTSEQSAARIPDAIQATASGMVDDSAQALAVQYAANRQRNSQATDEENVPYVVHDKAALQDMVRSCGLGAKVDASGRVSIGTGYWIAAQAELMAQRSVNAWETRFLFFTLMMFVFVFIGAQYALRTTQPALCPYFVEDDGSADEPTSWYFDECVGGESQTA